MVAGLEVEVRIVAEKLTNEEAVALERERIAFYGRGKLTNLTDGGEGPEGRQISSETREKIRRSNTGKKCLEETKRKLSAHNKGRKVGPRKPPSFKAEALHLTRFVPGQTAHNKGVPCREETKKKLSEKLKGHIPWNKGLKTEIAKSQ